MEGYTVFYPDKEEAPVRAAFRLFDVGAVVYGEEDVSCFGEGRERLAEGEGIRGL